MVWVSGLVGEDGLSDSLCRLPILAPQPMRVWEGFSSPILTRLRLWRCRIAGTAWSPWARLCARLNLRCASTRLIRSLAPGIGPTAGAHPLTPQGGRSAAGTLLVPR